MKNIINWLRFNLRLRSMNHLEAALFNMPSEEEFKQIAAEVARGSWAVTNDNISTEQFLRSEAGKQFVRDEVPAVRNMEIFPMGYAKLSRTEKPEDAKYLVWYLKTMEVWVARKAAELQNAVIELRDTTEQHLELGQMRIELGEVIYREKLDFAQAVLRLWKQPKTA